MGHNKPENDLRKILKVEHDEKQRVLTQKCLIPKISDDLQWEYTDRAEEKWTELSVGSRILTIGPNSFLWSLSHLTSLYLSHNFVTKIPSQISNLRNLIVLDLSHNHIKSVPPELSDLSNLQHLYLSRNQIRLLPYELGRIFRLQTFDLDGNRLSFTTKLIYEKDGPQELLRHLLDNLTINNPPPPKRRWIFTKDLNKEKHKIIFSIMTYNILAGYLVRPSHYRYCPSLAIDWNYRKECILKELMEYQPDIIALQEIETGSYKEFFQPKLAENEYESVFYPKSRAKTMEDKEERRKVDGCAVFWKKNRFSLKSTHLVEYQDLAIQNAASGSNMLNRVQLRMNIGVVVVLQIDNRPLVVCTTHNDWIHDFRDVKLIQVMMLLHELWKIVEETAEKFEILPGKSACDPMR